MKKTLPKMKSDRDTKRLLKRDLSDYLTRENFTLTSFEFAPKNRSITLRLSEGLLKAIQSAAAQHGTNYQRLIRLAIENLLRTKAA